MKKSRLYTILGMACAMGYSWLFFAFYLIGHGKNFSTCLFKNATGFPCPSCGSTRALVLLCHGDIAGSLWYNPIGIILAIIMIAVPLWLAYDLAMKKQTLFDSYQKAEKTMKIRWVATILLLVVVANWIWNFYKHL